MMLYLKIAAIVLIALLLMIPTLMIMGLVQEREGTQTNAILEISDKWGHAQTVTGPFITLPYTRYIKEMRKDSTEALTPVREYLHFLPDSLYIDGELIPEKRYRGIYEVVVYRSKMNISGRFIPPDLSNLDISEKDILFDKAVLTFGLSDLRGIEEQILLDWGETRLTFNPGTFTQDIVGSGIQTSVPYGDSMDFRFSIDVKGSHSLFFTPMGKTTQVNFRSAWTNPSFNGAFLPDDRMVSDSGFAATWNILHLNRNFPQAWSGNTHQVGGSAFGIDLLLPVDSYQKTYRSVRYAVLFIAFTFLTFFFIEILQKIFIHPIHYILVGISLVVFFTLLLSISEHIPFNLAYLVSALATILLIAFYVRAILKSATLTGLIAGILVLMYGFIFVILQLQDYSLLIGSIGLFAILAVVMFYARKVDWQAIGRNTAP